MGPEDKVRLDWMAVTWGMILAGIIFQVVAGVLLISADGAQAVDYILAGALFVIATTLCVMFTHMAFLSRNHEKAQNLADSNDC